MSANIDAFGNISSQAIANTLSEKERKANAYYEVVRKRLEKYGQPSIKTDDDGEKWWVQLVALGGIEKELGHRVQAIFGAFCLLLGGSTIVQLPLAKYKIYLTFSKSTSV